MEDNQNITNSTEERVENVNSQNKKSFKNNKNFKIIIAAILVYTVLVSGITVGIDRAVIKHRVEKAFDDAFSGEISDSTNDEDKPEDKKVTPVNLNQKFTVGGIAEVTFTKSEWVNEIMPSKASDDEAYSYYEDKEGETYFVLHAKIKNLSGTEISSVDSFGKCTLKVNEKYNVSGNIAAESQDGLDFYSSIKPLQESNVIFYISVSDGMYKTYESATLFVDLINNEEAIDTYSYDISDFSSYSISFK